jgi:hypothetical protein
METLATGIVLLSAIASPLAGASIRAIAGMRSARTVVDAVNLVVRSAALPAAAFVASRPGDAVQRATAVAQAPYREFTIYAYPFGSAVATEGIGTVEPQHLSAYRAMGAGRLLRSLELPALIFGHRVEGSARVVDLELGPHRQQTEVVSWLTDAGRRLWIIQAAEPLAHDRSAEVEFTAGTSVEASNLSTPTTVPSTKPIKAGPGSPVIQHVIVSSAATADPPAVRSPPWWSGICDANLNRWSFPLSSWDGLTACGPGPNRGGYDEVVEFFPGAWGEYEWECVELSMRWLFLEYGVRPYPADGSEVVADYSRADGGDLQRIANDGSSVPRPGDVLSMGATWEEGHTAVVTATNLTAGNGTIGILEQNMNGGNGKNTLSVVDDVVEPESGMPVTGWLQAPVSTVSNDPGILAADLVHDGGFNRGGMGGWRAWRHSQFRIERAGRLATRPYEGKDFGVTSTSVLGGGIYQDISLPIGAGDSFCADAEVVTAGAHRGARGHMTLGLLGRSRNQSSSVSFGPLPGKSRWTHVSTCVTATRPHSDIRVQFYDAPRTPQLGIDAVEVHQSFVENGGFNQHDVRGWHKGSHSQFRIERAGRLATRPYEGSDFGITSTSILGGGIYQDISLPIVAGERFCAGAEVVTAGAHPGARGEMTLWLFGDSVSQSSSVGFGRLPAKSRWTRVSTCVTATRRHSDIRVQFYDAPGTPWLGIDAVDVR